MSKSGPVLNVSGKDISVKCNSSGNTISYPALLPKMELIEHLVKENYWLHPQTGESIQVLRCSAPEPRLRTETRPESLQPGTILIVDHELAAGFVQESVTEDLYEKYGLLPDDISIVSAPILKGKELSVPIYEGEVLVYPFLLCWRVNGATYRRVTGIHDQNKALKKAKIMAEEAEREIADILKPSLKRSDTVCLGEGDDQGFIQEGESYTAMSFV